MVRIHDLTPSPGSRRKRKRVGRGPGSGHGKTSCRGHKGQKARSGGSIPPGFEGGQMPLQRRLPKRGFRNLFKKQYALVNVQELNQFESGAVVDSEALKAAGHFRRVKGEVKLLGKGTISYPLVMRVNKISRAARKAVEAAGGKVEII